MKKKLFLRLICALLTVLTLVTMIPAMAISVSAADEEVSTPNDRYTKGEYASAEEYIQDMKRFYTNGEYSLYCDEALGIVAYRNEKTGEVLFTNPWDMTLETNMDATIRAQLMSQIILTYSGNNQTKTLNSYTDAALKGQIIVKAIKNGLRVEYAIGERSARILVPQMIERSALETKILAPMEAAYKAGYISAKDYKTFESYFNDFFYTDPNLKPAKKEQIAKIYPVTQEKNIDIYICDVNASTKQKRWMEELILTYCPEYTFEEMDNDYDFVGYEETAISPPVFKMALEYLVDDLGVTVSLSGNGLRYDEKVYRVSDFQILPYIGTSYKKNDGYSLIPDGSGVLYELDANTTTSSRVYGDDFALYEKLYSYHNETVRMPVYGQVETSYTDKDGNWISKTDYAALSAEEKALYTAQSRGYFAIIEKGDSLASIAPNHVSNRQYASIIPTFITRQSDVSVSGWSVYADRRYVDDYSIRFILLSDDARAEEAGLSKYYECSWMGMACAYRDYLDAKDNGFERLAAQDVSSSIPLYIETFGCMDTVKKVLSMPITVSVALTSFEDIATMYDYLAANGVSNVNFKLKGYANGGLYSTVPYDLDWESAVGGDGGFEDLLEKAGACGFGIYPDFDFVYSTQGDAGSDVNMKKHASRTIDNRYTSKRVYSATYQTLISYYQMVMSPVTYSHFYENLEEEYAEYEAQGISLSTLGNALNSDYDEEKTTLREEAKEYVMEGLAYFQNKNYDIMLDGGNAYTWNYANHILNVPLDSSRYNAELSAVPFMGVVLHGYKEFAGSPLNMEGNLTYAMLKAMESGAAAYFVLSYANTELLKEDEVLSQNYSVRYDIWQIRLVEIYKELNAVLHDVQTKLIVNHERLDASRIPDNDELLKDIEEAAAEAQKQIADRLEAERVALLQELSDARADVTNAADSIYRAHVGTILSGKNQMLDLLASGNSDAIINAWVRPEVAAPTTEQVAALTSALNAYIITPYAMAQQALADAKAQIVLAKTGYEKMLAHDVNEQLLTDAVASLKAAVAEYVALLNDYESYTYSITEENLNAFIAGKDCDIAALEALMDKEGELVEISASDLEAFLFGAEKMESHSSIGVKELFDAYVAGLVQDGYYNAENPEASLINVQMLLNLAMDVKPVEPEQPEEPEQPGETTPDEEGDVVVPDAPKSKYAVDNNVVAVTYGDSKDAPYKTLLLNFNDYTIQTVYNGVTYTIAAYDYVVIMH